MSRRKDLERAIHECYSLVREYEEIQRLHPDPKERMRAQHLINEQQGLAVKYLKEYTFLCRRLGLPLAPDILELEVLFPSGRYGATEDNAEVVRVLFLSADPTDASRLRLGEELRQIQEKLQLAKLRERFELSVRMSVRPTDITQALLDVQPHIVHFSGHGTSEGALCFEDLNGQSHFAQPEALAALFKQFNEQIKCVLLNACYAQTQAIAIAEHIDCVIGMRREISDEAAIAFSGGFYQALGAGEAVAEAFDFGCIQIMLQGVPEHLTPVLIRKGQTPL